MIREHESYGLLSISKVQGTPTGFFGSELKPTNFICLEIKGAKMHSDRYGKEELSSTNTIVRVRMTNAQFAEAITSLNFGVGVPCTIERANGKEVENPPKQTNRIEESSKQNQLKSAEEIYNEYIDELVDIINKKGSAKQKKDAEQIRQVLKKRLTSDFEFARKMLRKAKEETMAEVKTEVEATIGGIIMKAGLDNIKQNNLLGVEKYE